MSVYYSSVVMIGHMFKGNDYLDFNDLEKEELDHAGDGMFGEWMCVGCILSIIDYESEKEFDLIDIDSLEKIRRDVYFKLKKLYPNKELNVQLYNVMDIV